MIKQINVAMNIGHHEKRSKGRTGKTRREAATQDEEYASEIGRGLSSPTNIPSRTNLCLPIPVTQLDL
jgi:hypothetical protein